MAYTTYGQDASQSPTNITETIESGNLAPGVQVNVDFSKFSNKSLVVNAIEQIKNHIVVAHTPI